MNTKQSTHTPGPWTAKELHANYSGFVVLAENRPRKGYMARVDDKSGVFSEADARLIAAAPELLAACKRALAAIRTAIPGEPDYLISVIAKAEGKL
jgi:hypothetical protein